MTHKHSQSSNRIVIRFQNMLMEPFPHTRYTRTHDMECQIGITRGWIRQFGWTKRQTVTLTSSTTLCVVCCWRAGRGGGHNGGSSLSVLLRMYVQQYLMSFCSTDNGLENVWGLLILGRYKSSCVLRNTK